LKQSPRAYFNKFSIIVARYELRRSSSNHSIFVRHYFADTIILAVYVDIVITGDDHINVLFSRKLI